MHRPLIILAALLMVATASAQPMNWSETHQVRIAYGDIPSTNATEAPSQWNFHETVLVNTSIGQLTWVVPAGHVYLDIDCECAFALDDSEAPLYRIAFPEGDDEVAMTFMHAAKGDLTGFATGMTLGDDARVFIYAADGTAVRGPVAPTNVLPAASAPGFNVYDFEAAGPFWFSIAPAAAVEQEPAPFVTFWGLALGTLAGMAIWSLLVKQGVVQKRVRKQVAAVAAHKEVAKKESKDTLAARKRVLMAGLKELEVAKMNKDVELEVYDALKGELKKETVTVMRALEEAS